MTVVQLRNATEGRAHYDRKKAAAKTSMDAMRCVKRRLSDLIYKTMLDDVIAAQRTGPGGQRGNDSVCQSDRLTAHCQLIGQVNSRTRHHEA